MVTTPPARKEDVKDPIGKIGWPKEKGRDGERTPMQWDTSRNAGFTTSPSPWLPVPPSYTQRNVEVESKNPDSLLNFYKQLIVLRREMPALRDGAYVAVNREDPDVLSYLRKSPGTGESVLVVLNMSKKPKTLSFDLKPEGVAGDSARPLLSNPGVKTASVPLNAVQVAPFGTFVGAVQ
jgi:alpha-glucosidase